jgi:hypothetical protein
VTQIARVVIEDTASATDIEATTVAFRQLGFTRPVEPIYARRSAELLPWVVQATLAVPFAAFFASFGAEAGKDAYGAAKAWIRALWTQRREAAGREGTVHLEDAGQSHLILASTLPEEALDALGGLDWSRVVGDYLVWDDQGRVWRDPTKR